MCRVGPGPGPAGVRAARVGRLGAVRGGPPGSRRLAATHVVLSWPMHEGRTLFRGAHRAGRGPCRAPGRARPESGRWPSEVLDDARVGDDAVLGAVGGADDDVEHLVGLAVAIQAADTSKRCSGSST